MPAPTFLKDPAATLDYGFDWSERGWLDAGETILTANWATAPAGLTIVTTELLNAATIATAWITGGSAGTDYTISCRIATSAGRIDERSMVLRVRNR